jgi:hypothetical protein
MRIHDRVAMAVALLALGCANSGGANPTPGRDGGSIDETTGPTGRRGGGTGTFGGVDDDGGASYDLASLGDAIVLIGDDGAIASGADAPMTADGSRDRGPDVIGPAPDAAPDIAPAPDTSPATLCQQCADIEKRYSDAVARARSCTPGLKGQCQQKVSVSLSCPCSQTWVSSTAEPDAYAKQYQAAGCGTCRYLCPLACTVLTSGVCSPSKLAAPAPGSGTTPPIIDKGTCTDMNAAPGP